MCLLECSNMTGWNTSTKTLWYGNDLPPFAKGTICHRWIPLTKGAFGVLFAVNLNRLSNKQSSCKLLFQTPKRSCDHCIMLGHVTYNTAFRYRILRIAVLVFHLFIGGWGNVGIYKKLKYNHTKQCAFSGGGIHYMTGILLILLPVEIMLFAKYVNCMNLKKCPLLDWGYI